MRHYGKPRSERPPGLVLPAEHAGGIRCRTVGKLTDISPRGRSVTAWLTMILRSAGLSLAPALSRAPPRVGVNDYFNGK